MAEHLQGPSVLATLQDGLVGCEGEGEGGRGEGSGGRCIGGGRWAGGWPVWG